MHNDYFKNLKEVVHFYDTRDVLPTCEPGDTAEKITCWPPAENPVNVNDRQLGNLHLTDQEEDDIVAFLKTLTDNYKQSGSVPPSNPAATNRQPNPSSR